jgi:Cu-Zn family superoxide dismutase
MTMNGRAWTLAAAACLAGLAGCAGGGGGGLLSMKGQAPEQAPAAPSVSRAVAVLEGRSGSKLEGKAVFMRLADGRIGFRVDVRNVTPGLHAIHIHEHADCGDPAAKNAGGHWNPTARKHGRWSQADGEFHLGDLGNIEVGADGTGFLEITTDLWTMGDGGYVDVVGRSIIVHGSADDYTTQPTGNAGDRIGCGPIVAE